MLIDMSHPGPNWHIEIQQILISMVVNSMRYVANATWDYPYDHEDVVE